MRRSLLASLSFFCVVFTAITAEAIVIPLGNLFDDPTTETLANAIASDTFGATANVGDLGVHSVHFGLPAPTNIAPGVNFDFSNLGANASSAFGIFNDSAYGGGSIIRTTGVFMGTYTPVGNGEEQGIGMHANAAITFDLNAIRAAGGLTGLGFLFTGDGGLNDDSGAFAHTAVIVSDANGVVAGYVNGQQVAVTLAGDWFFSGTLPAPVQGPGGTSAYNVPISATDLYLTLVTASFDGIGSDQTVFSMAQLTSVEPPAPEPASAVLLACGLGLFVARRRGK